MAFVTEVWKCLWVSGWRGVAGPPPHIQCIFSRWVWVTENQNKGGQAAGWQGLP